MERRYFSHELLGHTFPKPDFYDENNEDIFLNFINHPELANPPPKQPLKLAAEGLPHIPIVYQDSLNVFDHSLLIGFG